MMVRFGLHFLWANRYGVLAAGLAFSLYWFTLAPMLFVAGMTSWALTKEIGFYYRSGNWLLLAIALIILSFEAWILIEGWQVFRRLRAKRGVTAV